METPRARMAMISESDERRPTASSTPKRNDIGTVRTMMLGSERPSIVKTVLAGSERLITMPARSKSCRVRIRNV